MCRSIKPLRKMDQPATPAQIHEAALQYVRKVSGFRKPSRINALVFDAAVQRVAEATRELLDCLQPGRALADFEVEPESSR